MYFAVEGPSGAGKTTLLNELLDRIDGIYYKGLSPVEVPRKKVKNYHWLEHATLLHVEQENPEIDIFHDRGFTEGVMREDEELLRAYQCHIDPIVIYVTANRQTLLDRSDKRNAKIREEIQKYKICEDLFDVIEIDTTDKTEQRAASELKEKIDKKKGGSR